LVVPQTQPHLGVAFERAEKRYGGIAALRQVSFEVRAGECVALLGPNGAGKSTLLKMAALLVRPTSGHVSFSGADGAAPPALKRRMGMVGHHTFLYEEFSAEENLSFFGKLYGISGLPTRVAEALEDAGLTVRAGDLVRTFSRGMRQRLTIARALLSGPSLLLLDEPSTGLDRQGIAWLARTLEALRRDGCTILISTHTRNETLDIVSRVVCLSSGRIERDSGYGGDPRPLLAGIGAEA
jgi:ABC-type multidrug transport system ATPase subunit